MKDMLNELKAIEDSSGLLAHRWKQLKTRYPRELDINWRANSRETSSVSRKLPEFDILKRTYLGLCIQLQNKYPTACKPTVFELRLLDKKLLRKLSVHRSIWIGKFNIDIFYDQFGSDRQEKKESWMRGLAVEIDGAIHNSEIKMRKDQHKILTLSKELGIGVISISNEEILSQQTSVIMSGLSKTRRLDSRARKRIWRRIYVYTIAANVSDANFKYIFGS